MSDQPEVDPSDEAGDPNRSGDADPADPTEPGPRLDLFVALRSRLVGPVLVVGLLCGLAGAAYLTVLDLLMRWIGPGDHSAAAQAMILVAAGVGLTVLTRLLGSSGTVELLVDNIHVSGGDQDLRRLRSLLPTSLLCIGAGGALGPEAPLVQTCGSVGTWIAGRRHLSRSDLRILTITGMAAGFSVLFGAPLGAALFALEILHRDGLQYYEALLPALIGALAGYGAYAGFTGMGLEPVWAFPEAGPVLVTDLGWAVLCGVLGAVGAIGFTYLSIGLRRLVRPVPAVIVPALGGLLLGALAWWSPFALTNGERQVDLITGGALTATALAVAIVAKLAGTLVTLTSRWKGGFIIPLFFLGIASGQLLHLALPSTNVTLLMAGLAVAICVGVTKTPLGSTIAVTQMAGLPLLPMTLVAAVVALVLTSGTGLIETQRERAGETRPSTP